MASQLVIIRGNSGSGKSTVAKKLQERLGEGTLLISQDTVRRDMLRVKDTANNSSIELMKQMALFGLESCDYVILEGILVNDRYQEMLLELIRAFSGKAEVYYFDLLFEVTMERHLGRNKSEEFGFEELKRWWNDRDYLGTIDEKMIKANQEEDEIVEWMVSHLE